MGLRAATTAVAVACIMAAPPITGASASHATTPATIGFTLDGLQDWLPSRLSPGRIDDMKAQITAASNPPWSANTVRFQIVQAKLDSSPVYLSQVRQITDFALARRLTVVLNAQTEGAPGTITGSPLPTAATQTFWSKLLPLYRNNPRVVFDLFNEPRNCSWRQWRDAFQPLVSWVRSRASNPIWVEGLNWGSTLQGVPLLLGRGVTYSFHHPGKPWPHSPGLPEGPRLWDKAFGYLAARGVPVVDGEFVNYSGGYHFDNPVKAVPLYLRYLTAHHIGMTAWTLGLPGVINSTSSLASATIEPQGAGSLIQRWFATERRTR